MASKRYYITAELEWAKVFEVNRDKTGPDGVWAENGGACTVTAWLDEEAQKIYKSSGSRIAYMKKYDAKEGEKVTLKDSKGRKAIQFRRFFTHNQFPEFGGAPQVVHADGTPWDINEDGLIGNGSVGIVCFTVYDTKSGPGCRLEGIQILEHIPYESDKEYVPAAMFSARTTTEEKPKATKPKKAPVAATADLDDELPF
jgi:hypothetical protein